MFAEKCIKNFNRTDKLSVPNVNFIKLLLPKDLATPLKTAPSY